MSSIMTKMQQQHDKNTKNVIFIGFLSLINPTQHLDSIYISNPCMHVKRQASFLLCLLYTSLL